MNDRIWRALRELREQLKWYANQRVAAIVRFSQVTANTASGNADAVQGNTTVDETDTINYQYTVRRLWPFGIRSRPPTGVDSVVVHAFGGSTNGLMVGAESAEYGPDDLEEGETAIYSHASGAVIKIDKNGAIEVTSSSGQAVTVSAGGNITLTANSGAGTVDVNATSVTVGSNPVLNVLVQGAFDSLGVPVTQAPTSLNTLKSS
jgi:phage gp45-like